MQVAKNYRQKVYLLKCQHKSCGESFYSTRPFAKFCDEHKKRKYKYRRSLALKKDCSVDISPYDVGAYRIKSKKKVSRKIIIHCLACDKKMEITFTPMVSYYPMYCERHRNRYKRLMHVKNHGGYQGTKFFEKFTSGAGLRVMSKETRVEVKI